MSKDKKIKCVEYPEVDKIYKHYKGGSYRVLTLAKHTENNETLVIYQSQEFGSVHARPLSMWFDEIRTGVYRFTLHEG